MSVYVSYWTYLTIVQESWLLNSSTLGNKNVLLVCWWDDLSWVGWSAFNCIEMRIYYYIRVGKNPYLQDVP
jgi:hypothetical protein